MISRCIITADYELGFSPAAEDGFFMVYLVESKPNLKSKFYVDLRTDFRFHFCHDIAVEKYPLDPEYLWLQNPFVKNQQAPSFKISSDKLQKVKDKIHELRIDSGTAFHRVDFHSR